MSKGWSWGDRSPEAQLSVDLEMGVAQLSDNFSQPFSAGIVPHESSDTGLRALDDIPVVHKRGMLSVRRYVLGVVGILAVEAVLKIRSIWSRKDIGRWPSALSRR